MKVKYFAWVRERVGKAEETIEPPANVRTVDDLIAWLSGRGENLCPCVREAEGDPRRDRPRPCQAGRRDRRRPRDRLLPADDRRLVVTIPVTIRIQQDDFDVAREITALSQGRTDIGAVVTSPASAAGPRAATISPSLTLEHYPGMAEAEIKRHAR